MCVIYHPRLYPSFSVSSITGRREEPSGRGALPRWRGQSEHPQSGPVWAVSEGHCRLLRLQGDASHTGERQRGETQNLQASSKWQQQEWQQQWKQRKRRQWWRTSKVSDRPHFPHSSIQPIDQINHQIIYLTNHYRVLLLFHNHPILRLVIHVCCFGYHMT